MGVNQRSQVEMTDDEIDTYLTESRNCTLATIGKDGRPHLVAMWYAYFDGAIWFETKGRAQKALNVSRDGRATVLVEDGLTYDLLRGVSIDGTAEIVDDPDVLWQVGVGVWERYNGPYSDEVKPLVEMMMHKRVAIKVTPTRMRSWDHRKLGLPTMEVGGTTDPNVTGITG